MFTLHLSLPLHNHRLLQINPFCILQHNLESFVIARSPNCWYMEPSSVLCPFTSLSDRPCACVRLLLMHQPLCCNKTHHHHGRYIIHVRSMLASLFRTYSCHHLHMYDCRVLIFFLTGTTDVDTASRKLTSILHWQSHVTEFSLFQLHDTPTSTAPHSISNTTVVLHSCHQPVG
jgi:hypothetical protein